MLLRLADEPCMATWHSVSCCMHQVCEILVACLKPHVQCETAICNLLNPLATAIAELRVDITMLTSRDCDRFRARS